MKLALQVFCWLIIGLGFVVVIGGFSLFGCSNSPTSPSDNASTVVTNPPDLEVCSWCDALGHALCLMYGACGTLTLAPNQVGAASAPATTWDIETGLPMNEKEIVTPCVDRVERRCYWVNIFGIRYWYCTQGNCPAEPQPE